MMRIRPVLIPIVSLLITIVAHAEAPSTSAVVGPAKDGGYLVPTQQLIRPAGKSVEYHGRPVDLALSPDAKTAYVKDNAQLLAIDVDRWEITQQLKYPSPPAGGGGTMHGIAVARDGKRVYVTTGSALCEATVGDGGKLAWGRSIALPPEGKKETAYPCGVALSGDGKIAWVCLSINNTMVAVDLEAGKIARRVEVGVAPYGVVLSDDGRTAYVSNWGGRRPEARDATAKSADAEVLIDKRGVASSGTIGVVDLAAGRQIAQIDVGLHPADLQLSRDSAKLYVANANSDTVSVVDTAARKVTANIAMRPDPTLPFGSGSNALALSSDERTLFVANGGNNAVAVVKLDPTSSGGGLLQGFIPAGWYPGALAIAADRLIVANVKGVGSRDPANEGKWSSHSYRGSVTLVDPPDEPTLARYAAQVHEDARVPQSLRAWEKAQSGIAPVPVPKRVGEPSVFEHVVYVIKENRTYDQVLGDIGKGNSDPRLCVFGREVTPNHHALAEQFALLDNFYCNGVISADGHAWATEGVTVDYLEKSFGAWARSYPFWGGDPLAFAPTGFIWDNVLLHGLSFRNYGEMVNSVIHPPRTTFSEVYRDYVNKTGKVRISNVLGLDPIGPYTCEDYPGWNLGVTDQRRVDAFIAEFEQYKKKREWPNLVIVYLPQDHTAGTRPGGPTPAAQIADNDYALGRVVDAVSHSEFWPKTCIFVIEDDPQAGFDHVDGHRSFCLVISPHTKRGSVVSNFYNQTSVLHTMELMLGVPPMTQLDAMAPSMEACFTGKADLSPFKAVPNNVPFDQTNPEKSSLKGAELQFAELSEQQRLDVPDAANEDALNRILWASARGSAARYPAELAGAHGKGLKALGLAPDALHGARDADDDD